jgi:ABC-type nitrate/sulfonate/bicarbonate transport system permease component
MRYGKTLIYIALSVFLLIYWEYAAQNNTVRVLLSSPTLIVDYFAQNTQLLAEATWVTFIEALSGLLIATLFSFTVMIVCFYFPKLMEFVLPIMVISQVIPLITLAPLFIILFGIGIYAKVMMASLLCFFPIFVNFANGVKLINTNIQELLFIANATTTQKIRHAFFPLALPSIMTGLKIGAIVAEFSGAEVGLGRNLFISALRLEPEIMMCSLILSAFLGAFFFGIIHFFEYKIGSWYITNNIFNF